MSVAADPVTPADPDTLVTVENLVKYFPVRTSGLIRRTVGQVHAVDDVTFSIPRGKTVGLVGETGSGKSTLARCIAGLIPITSGRVTFEGRQISGLSRRAIRPFRREIQMIFQDPYGSLNPRRRVGAIIGDPFAIHKTATGAERKRQVQELMERVGLNPEHYNRFPSEFSGGQRQRLGRGHVPGPDRRARSQGPGVPLGPAPLHDRAAVGRAGRGSGRRRQQAADHPDRGNTVPDRPALGLQVPPALPEGPAAVQRDRTAA
jgi:ABC-type lipoprotein export system ATPase subunit